MLTNCSPILNDHAFFCILIGKFQARVIDKPLHQYHTFDQLYPLSLKSKPIGSGDCLSYIVLTSKSSLMALNRWGQSARDSGICPNRSKPCMCKKCRRSMKTQFSANLSPARR